MVGSHKLIIVLNNLLPVFIFIFGITTSWDTLILTEASVGRRTLATDQNHPDFISIDCGVEENYLNVQTGIFYNTDKDFINTGENHDVSPSAINNNYYTQYWKEYRSLRSFPDGNKNCYTLKPKQGKNNNYRIRASFLYGNYDDKNEIPEFDIYVGVNYWDTVKLPSAWYMLFLEIIHFFTADTEYVCLVNTGSGIPFISALELRFSNNSAYNRTNSGAALKNIGVIDQGTSNNDSLRYKDDGYDRIWLSRQFPSSVPINTSLSINNPGDDSYKVPAEVLRTAVRPVNGSRSLNYFYQSSRFPTSQYLVFFHFAEIEESAQDRLRQFTITLNGFKSRLITLQYLRPFSINSQDLLVQGVINFTIDATEESDLPPILNALEYYRVLPLPFSPTDPSDGDAIMAVKQAYNINRNDWQGDPCLPKEHTWSVITCRFNSTPRIISLNLSASKLTGEISSSFSDLQAIESLDLSYNELTGPIPEVLAQMPKLKVLNLSGNKLTGLIPQSLKDKFDNGSLLLRWAENPDSCLMEPCTRKKKNVLVPVVATSVSFLVLLIVLGVPFIFSDIRRRKQGGLVIAREGSLSSKNRPFTYSEIVNITANFTSVIGEGGFGKVYLGTLKDGTKVAVKLLSPSSKQGHKEFRAEAQLLTIVHHKKLVSLIGCCEEDGKMALVYEYMANGNLREHLSGTESKTLIWKDRLQIAVDAAHGLEYLHNGCTPPTVHRDLKTSNILLTENMQAKIADFGLSKAFVTENASHISTRPAGTPGYLDPEFHKSGNLNRRSDIYSFGIILFELITGQPAVLRGSEYNIHILQWVTLAIERGDIQSIVDPKLKGEFNTNAVWKAVEIAMACTQPTSNKRPDISHVLAELKDCLAPDQMAPKNPQTMQTTNLIITSCHSPSNAPSGGVDSYTAPSPR